MIIQKVGRRRQKKYVKYDGFFFLFIGDSTNKDFPKVGGKFLPFKGRTELQMVLEELKKSKKAQLLYHNLFQDEIIVKQVSKDVQSNISYYLLTKYYKLESGYLRLISSLRGIEKAPKLVLKTFDYVDVQ